MAPYSTLALLSAILAVLFSFVLPMCGRLVAWLSLFCTSFLYSTSAFLGSVLGGFAQFFGVSVTLLSFWWMFRLDVPASVPRAQLFPLVINGIFRWFSDGEYFVCTRPFSSFGSVCPWPALLAARVFSWGCSSFGFTGCSYGYFYGCCDTGAVHSCSSCSNADPCIPVCAYANG